MIKVLYSRHASEQLLLFALRSSSREAIILPLYLTTIHGIMLSHAPVMEKLEAAKHWTPPITASIHGFLLITEPPHQAESNNAHKDILSLTTIDYVSY
ncbi:c26db691-8ea4-4490-a296-f844d662ee11-CDS [Sclerotinia trifoliorum]|uniref:C26db691-8ea4-4490-a296-f844d662ee11-CDS n=1 Tax=Sclerotinia trifoliorum TaxID=28548 RepID=A0A8H2VYL9_9HELO|nr:c26db691-8ea4-4490-a296-f844d662ee11-CDS [Sclerotinia trifoliorum]